MDKMMEEEKAKNKLDTSQISQVSQDKQNEFKDSILDEDHTQSMH